MRLSLGGKLWDFYRNRRPKEAEVHDGYCSDINKPNKSIWVSPDLEGEHELEILIHEMLHATNWRLDEEFITKDAQDIARALYRIGYRKTP